MHGWEHVDDVTRIYRYYAMDERGGNKVNNTLDFRK